MTTVNPHFVQLQSRTLVYVVRRFEGEEAKLIVPLIIPTFKFRKLRAMALYSVCTSGKKRFYV